VDALITTEFEAARSEINLRTQLGLSIIGLDLAALGSGLSLVSKTPSIVVALAAVSAYLWSLWLDQASQVWKLAAYIALRLQPRAGPGVLGWESFLRALDEGGSVAQRVVFPNKTGALPSIPRLRTRNIGFYISMLLGGTPVLLVGSYLATAPLEHAGAAIWIALGLAAVVWLNSLRLYGDFRMMAQALDEAIRTRLTDDDGDG
jgi:hypothetical protein